MAKIIMQEPADQIHSSDPFWLPPKDNILFENYVDTTTNARYLTQISKKPFIAKNPSSW